MGGMYQKYMRGCKGRLGLLPGASFTKQFHCLFMEKKDPPGGGSKGGDYGRGRPGKEIVNVGDYLCVLWGVGFAGGPIWEFGGWGSV